MSEKCLKCGNEKKEPYSILDSCEECWEYNIGTMEGYADSPTEQYLCQVVQNLYKYIANLDAQRDIQPTT